MIRRALIFLLGASLAFGGILAVTPGDPVTVDASEGINVSVNGTWSGTFYPSNLTDGLSGNATDVEETTEAAERGDRSDPGGIDRAAVEQAIHERVNEIRAERGLSRLEMPPKLREAARLHSEDMARDDYFSHTSPEGGTFEDRYAEVGYNCRVPVDGNRYLTGAENIAYRTTRYTNETEIGEAIVVQWMNSQGHRENLLEPAWGNEGIGVTVAPGGEIYATQNFC